MSPARPAVARRRHVDTTGAHPAVAQRRNGDGHAPHGVPAGGDPQAGSVPHAGSEDGAVTLWLLGLSLVLLSVGALSLDLWHVLAERRALAGIADAAAYAGASGIDEAAFRADASLLLDPSRARALADHAVRRQADQRSLAGWRADADAASVTVEVTGNVDTFLLPLLDRDLAAIEVTVRSTARPEAS